MYRITRMVVNIRVVKPNTQLIVLVHLHLHMCKTLVSTNERRPGI